MGAREEGERGNRATRATSLREQRCERAELEERLGFRFRDPSLLDAALMHASWANETPGGQSNERLEFLGDAVIGLVVSHQLYEANPDWHEGDLTRALHELVDRRGLAKLARRFEIGPHLRLGRTEQTSGGGEKDSILADAMEAIIASVYLDSGLAAVIDLAHRAYGEALDPRAARVGRDPKTHLQERVMSECGEFPRYELVRDSEIEGDAQRFTVQVCVCGTVRARGVGRSKRAAERAAAAATLAQDDAAPHETGEGR